MTWFLNHWWLVLLSILTLPLVCIAVFAQWLNRKPGLEIDAAVKCWDVFVKLISAMTIVVTGAMLFAKFVDQQEQAARQRAVQDKKEADLRSAEFLRQKLVFDTERHQRKRKLYDEAKIVSARLATGDPSSGNLAKRFEELYFADLIGVEDLNGSVEAAMVQLRRKLRREQDAPPDSLEQLALKLATACETELKESEKRLLAQHQEISFLVTAKP